MANGKVEGDGSGHEGEPDRYHGEHGDLERNAVVEHPVTVKVDNPSFFLPSFQAGRAEVPAAEFHVAEGAQESAAMIARDHRLFLGMVKTARLILRQCLSLFSGTNAPIKGRKDVDPNRDVTGRAWDEVRSIIEPCKNWRMTVCARDLFHETAKL